MTDKAREQFIQDEEARARQHDDAVRIRQLAAEIVEIPLSGAVCDALIDAMDLIENRLLSVRGDQIFVQTTIVPRPLDKFEIDFKQELS